MPRTARTKSASGIYHVMLRGANRQQLFKEAEDCERFIQIVKDCKAISGFKLFAYCLMGNHVHLLIKPEKEPIEQVFKRIGCRFVYWFNVKYQRTGHLFQDRFKSEPVDDDAYFLTVIRYIHQNPVKAGICKKPREYEYSSYREFEKTPELVDCDFVFSTIAKDEFISFNNTYENEKVLDIDDNEKRINVTDEQAKRIICKASKCNSAAEFQRLNPKSQDKFITEFKKKGLSIRQISRLTGVSYYVVQKV